jgi:hypothetical protein
MRTALQLWLLELHLLSLYHNTSPASRSIPLGVDELFNHKKMYAIADKYDILGLQDLAKDWFKQVCEVHWNTTIPHIHIGDITHILAHGTSPLECAPDYVMHGLLWLGLREGRWGG